MKKTIKENISNIMELINLLGGFKKNNKNTIGETLYDLNGQYYFYVGEKNQKEVFLTNKYSNPSIISTNFDNPDLKKLGDIPNFKDFIEFLQRKTPFGLDFNFENFGFDVVDGYNEDFDEAFDYLSIDYDEDFFPIYNKELLDLNVNEYLKTLQLVKLINYINSSNFKSDN